jgi:hypothetical protein
MLGSEGASGAAAVSSKSSWGKKSNSSKTARVCFVLYAGWVHKHSPANAAAPQQFLGNNSCMSVVVMLYQQTDAATAHKLHSLPASQHHLLLFHCHLPHWHMLVLGTAATSPGRLS